LCLLIPCLFFGFGCVFASAGLLGLDWGAGQRLLQQRSGVCPPAQPLLPRCLTQDPRGSDPGLCRSHLCTALASHVCVRLGMIQGQGRWNEGPSQSTPPHCFHAHGLWPWLADLQGPQSHWVPPGVFLLASSQHVWALVADPSFVPIGFTWASSGEPQGPRGSFQACCPLTPAVLPCCEGMLPRQSQVVLGLVWGGPFSLPEGRGGGGSPPVPNKGCGLQGQVLSLTSP